MNAFLPPSSLRNSVETAPLGLYSLARSRSRIPFETARARAMPRRGHGPLPNEPWSRRLGLPNPTVVGYPTIIGRPEGFEGIRFLYGDPAMTITTDAHVEGLMKEGLGARREELWFARGAISSRRARWTAID